MIRGAVFDFDGTLFDSMYVWENIGEDYLRSLGYEPRENLRETFKNFSLSQAAAYYRSEYGVTLSETEIIQGVNALAERAYRHDILLKTGADVFLEKLSKKGVRMCIATASDKSLAKASMERCKISGYFSEILTCDAVGYSKTSPEIYRAAAEHMGVKKEETIVFEDTVHALKTAKNDGFVTAGIFDEYENNQEGVKTYSDIYMKDFSDFNTFWRFASI